MVRYKLVIAVEEPDDVDGFERGIPLGRGITHVDPDPHNCRVQVFGRGLEGISSLIRLSVLVAEAPAVVSTDLVSLDEHPQPVRAELADEPRTAPPSRLPPARSSSSWA